MLQAAAGGNVLVHCSQGVSRSTALAIAYLMWKTGRSYDEVFSQVKAHRGVANPNIGFICQVCERVLGGFLAEGDMAATRMHASFYNRLAPIFHSLCPEHAT